METQKMQAFAIKQKKKKKIETEETKVLPACHLQHPRNHPLEGNPLFSLLSLSPWPKHETER
jgi:hypothetical protein